jgi:uncharacterized protein YfaS (alpha-2-macroglobulin family)
MEAIMERLKSFLILRNTLLIIFGVVVLAAGIVLAPMALRGPQVVQISPADNANNTNPQGQIRLEFDQWVRPATVATALQLDPPSTLIVVDTGRFPTRSVTLQPQDGLRYGAEYRMTLGTGVKNLLGRSLDQAVTVAFATAPYINMVDIGPQDDSADVAVNAPLTVEFDAPVVTADEVAAAAADPQLADAMPQPVSLSPATAGVGRWLSPTLFSFSPEGGLHAAITYTATVQAELTSSGAARLEQPVTWSFSTEAPVLMGTRPFDGATEVAADSPIEVRLAADVDVNSASQHFTLTNAATGTPVAGTTEQFQNGFFFKPSMPFQRNGEYEATLTPGIHTSTGASLNAEALSWSFTVIGDLAVEQVIPPPDSSEVLTTTNQISVRFNHPVVATTTIDAQADLPSPLTITPAPAGVGRWLDTSTYVYSLTAGLAPSTSYQVQAAAGLKDQTGGELRDAYSWTFSTITPQVLETTPADNQGFGSPQAPITIVFNQAMDRSSLQGAIRLSRGEAAVPGTVTLDGHVAAFTPSAALERGASYELTVAAGAQSAQGDGRLAQEYRSTFRVAPLPQLLRSQPLDGDTRASPNEHVRLFFSTPMDWPSVVKNLTIEPKPSEVYTGTNQSELYLYFPLKPETDYRITVGAAASDPYGVSLGQDATISFRTTPLPPALSFIGARQIGAYNAYAPTRVPVRYVNLNSLDYELYRIEPVQVAQLIGDYTAWHNYQPDPANLIAEDSQELQIKPNTDMIDRIDLGQLDAGIYYMSIRLSGQQVDQQILAVSPYALTIKRNATELFVWAVDLASGKPVNGLELMAGSFIFDSKVEEPSQGDLIVSDVGRTDGEGILRANLTTLNPYNQLFLWSPVGERFAFATTNWSNGIGPWEFGLPANYESNPTVGNLATDRPIYRPDQTVRIRGVLRLDQDGRYTLPNADQDAILTIYDSQYNTVLSTTLPLNEFGAFNTQLALDRSALLGNYSMRARLAEDGEERSVYGSFYVTEYRKPVFEVTVTPNQSDVLSGDALEMTVDARYFAGGVLADAPVRWRLLAAPYYFASETAPNYRFDDVDDASDWYRRFDSQRYDGNELIADGTATTDTQGRFKLNLPSDLYGGSRTVILDIDVTDVGGQVISAQGRATVHAGAFYIGLRPEGYVAEVGQDQWVALITLDPQDQPVGGRALEVGIYQREWYSVREQGADGRLYWTSNYTDTLVETKTATSDAQGRASISFTPQAAGSYRIGAEGRDAAGRVIKASAFTWAYGGAAFWGITDSNRIDLIADKDSYEPGDTANILITAPYDDMNALMTIERGTVIEHRLFTLQGSSELLRVPVSADYAPNVYVSVVLVKPTSDDVTVPDLRMGLINLPVSTEQQELNITITPDREQAGPRDEVTYAIRATDYTGKGVRAELSLALVDKAILTLADDPNPSLKQSFYEKRPLSIFTAQSLTALVDRVTIRLQPGDKGGGGGEGDTMFVRRDFPDTAYWNPTLVTADDGTASVTVALPDSLTTWNMTAQGLTTDTLVGQASQELVATRPLLVRPALPRFLTVGDEFVLQAVVQNNTGAAVDAVVTVDPGIVQISDPAEQRIQVPANGQTVVRWQAQAPTAGESAIRLTATGGGTTDEGIPLEDRIEHILPIQRFVTPETVASAGQVRDTTVETIEAPTQDGQEGEVVLELTPSLAAGVESGLDYLENYPYGCIEQTVSRFLPNAVTYRLFEQMGLDNQDLKASLEQNLATGLQRIYALQNLDGGWGWWGNDAGHPYITAYVVQGLVEARKAGYGVDQQVLDQGIAYLTSTLDQKDDRDSYLSPQSRLNTRAYILFVLAEAGQPDRGRTVNLYDERAKLDLYGRAYLLMTLQALGNNEQRIDTLIGELMSSAILRPADAHWEERSNDYWTMNSNTRTTALALQTLVRTDPDNFLVPNAVRYLMSLRDHGHWLTTQETATTLMALSEYIAESGELEGDYSYRVALNEQTREEDVVNRENLSDPVEVVVALAELRSGANQLAIQRQAAAGQSGKGQLSYTLRMRYYQDAEAVEPLDQGIGVQREYIAVDTATLTPTGQLVSEVVQGDVVQVRLTLTLPAGVHYLTVEDMLPAGLEALDTSLKTVSAAAQTPELTETGNERPYWWYFGQTAIHDNRVALFATYLDKGTYTYTYLARATTVGAFQTLPTTAYQMYSPEVFGRGAGARFVVREP